MKNVYKKIIPYVFILIVLTGSFGLPMHVQAECRDGATGTETTQNDCIMSGGKWVVYSTAYGKAQTCAGEDGLSGVLCRVAGLLNSLLKVLIALGVVYFVWGVVTYFIGSDEEAKSTGRDRIIYGIIGLAVILSVWGLVKLVTNTFFGEKSTAAPTNDQLKNLLPK